MSELRGDRLYDLLPAIYRLRDAEAGGPLRALLAIVASELHTIADDIAGLYDNWFIETCDEWVVPYIGDLLGVTGLHAASPAFSQRAYVANTLAYRRRKGTATMLEQLARDVTGWPAVRVVEFFQQIAATQYLDAQRPANLRTPDLRDRDQLELLGTPFSSVTHSVDLRQGPDRIPYNIPAIGLFLWRLQSYAVAHSSARAEDSHPGCYFFNPLGLDAPLFNLPRPEDEITHLAEEINVPGRLRPLRLDAELEAWRQALVDAREPHPLFLDAQRPAFRIVSDGRTVPAEAIVISDLSDWRRPAGVKAYTRRADPPTRVERTITVAVDPVLGRLAFAAGLKPKRVEVSYAYGFGGDIGGGPYHRDEPLLAERSPAMHIWMVGQDPPPVAEATAPQVTYVATLLEAIQLWNATPHPAQGTIKIRDSRSYSLHDTGPGHPTLPPGSRLLITAADGQRPHLRGNLFVMGGSSGSAQAGELVLNGLLIEGSITLQQLGSFRMSHCTYTGALSADALCVQVDHSIGGSIAANQTSLSVANSILVSTPEISDSPLALEHVGATGSVVLQGCTVFGEVEARELEASNCIFTQAVRVQQRQTGCVRFSYVPENARTPQRYRCQPDLALNAAADASERALVRARLQPAFTSSSYGHPGYAQLARACPPEIQAGADDGAEMGVFHSLQQPQREANLRAILDEYLRFGLEPGIFSMT